MDVHQNARTTPHSRTLIVDRLASGWSVKAVAAALGVTGRTVRKWRDRYAAEGAAGLADRSSRPHRSPRRLQPGLEAAMLELRRQRLSGPAIARRLGQPGSTVGQVLRRNGLGRLAALEPRRTIVRYERERPGELLHVDTKKLGRIAGIGHRITGHRPGMVRHRGIGWDHLHVAVDDASRLAYTELLPDDRKTSATAFLSRALAWFAAHGVRVERVMTDNRWSEATIDPIRRADAARRPRRGSAYRSRDFARLITAAGLRHLRTRPYTPRTNGLSALPTSLRGIGFWPIAERFIQSSLREWAYERPFTSSRERQAALIPWTTAYNYYRPHAALGGQPPITRIAKDNLLGSDS